MPKKNKYKIFIIAGEASGDIIGGKLISALKKSKKDIEFKGVGGDNMINAGLVNTFPIHDLSVMGYLEIIPAIPRILNRLKQTVRNIVEYKPDLVVTIDSPGFNFRIAHRIRQLFGKNIKIVHYVAPSVWAYKPERVLKVAKLFDHLLMILPIEKPYFEAHIPCTYVGHPIIEQDIRSKNPIDLIRKKHAVRSDEKLITIMPGSRRGEVEKHLEYFTQAIEIVRKTHKVKVFIPTLRSLESFLSGKIKNVIISAQESVKKDLITASDVALIKSGTSSVEMMSYKVPTVVAYRMNPLTYLYLKNKIKVKFASLANIISDKEIIPEFIQNDCTSENLANAIKALLDDTLLREKQLEGFAEVTKLFKGEGKKLPSEQAADVVLGLL
jgi:lipid-A-disaccharide synthase